MRERNKAYLVLADGKVFEGFSMGKTGVTIGEVVFNTCTSAYTDILSDPTYYGQIVAQTYPIAANRGITPENEGGQIMSNGYIVREWCDVCSDGNEMNLDDYLKSRDIVGICGIDTRHLTRYLRDKGYVNGAITDSLENMEKRFPYMITFVNKVNPRSYAAHTRKALMDEVTQFSYNNNNYWMFGCKTSNRP